MSNIKTPTKPITANEISTKIAKELGAETIFYRAYIRKVDDIYDFEVECSPNDDLEAISEYFLSIDPRYLISFQSSMIIDGKICHIPMIDFSLRTIKDLNLGHIGDTLRALNLKNGYILKSGRCFHYYGRELLSEDEFTDFAERYMKLEAIGDRYPVHQMRRGAFNLRQTSNGDKPMVPELVAVFENGKVII